MTTTLDTLNTARSTPHASLNTARRVTGPTTFDVNALKRSMPAAGDQTPASFQAAMNAIAARKSTKNDVESPEDAKLRATAETLVNQLFMGTMLKQMRSSPFKDSTMSGGKAGDAYAGLFDQQLAGKAGGGMAGGLVDVMVRRMKNIKHPSAAVAATLNAKA